MNRKNIFSYVLIAMVVVCSALVISNKNGKETVSTSNNPSADFSSLSNKKVCWGIKRADNHKQPDVGNENKKLMDKCGSLFMGNSEKKYVYLTFDAGYEAGYTDKILETLTKNDVKGTFFITGHYFNTQPELVQKMIENGNTVGNHAPRYLMSGIVA